MPNDPVAPPVPAEVEACFRELADSVAEQDWQRLVAGTTDAVLKRLAACGALDGASPEALAQAYPALGQLLVDHTNVALTLLAAARSTRGEQG
ncbi:MAG: hypothetical protein VKP62_03770 [Candidatus Sericytochromatia bacterium]|nr:hypothetical protein [Candidatus Sericytochromatia bacterium]